MKRHLIKNLIGIGAAAALSLWLAACATQTSDVAYTMARSTLHFAPLDLGAQPAVTVEQRHQLQNLPSINLRSCSKLATPTIYFPTKLTDVSTLETTMLTARL